MPLRLERLSLHYALRVHNFQETHPTQQQRQFQRGRQPATTLERIRSDAMEYIEDDILGLPQAGRLDPPWISPQMIQSLYPKSDSTRGDNSRLAVKSTLRRNWLQTLEQAKLSDNHESYTRKYSWLLPIRKLQEPRVTGSAFNWVMATSSHT